MRQKARKMFACFVLRVIWSIIIIILEKNVEEKQRCYFVIDMKSFFASVECAERGLDPLTTKLVVADESRGEKTICLAVSPALKALGVKNRCRLYEVPKNIDFIIAKPRMKKYIEYASEIYGIYLQYIDKNDIHVYSIDESFIDVTDYLKLYNIRAKEFANKLMDEIYEKLHIPSTAGIGTNLYLAKIALDITAKHAPDHIGWLNEEKFIKTLWHHIPLSDFWGISRGTVNRLAKFGIIDMADIAKCDPDLLYEEFGINAELLIDHAWGRETCRMSDIKNYKTKKKSMSGSQILPHNYNFKDAKLVMDEMVQNACFELASQHFATPLLHLYVGYGDKKEDGTKGSVRMSVCTNLFSFIGKYMDDLFDKVVNRVRPIRKIGYDFADLVPDSEEFYDLFTDMNKVKKEKNAVKSVIAIKDKFGKNAVLSGIDLYKNATQKERNNMIGGHNSGESEDV